MVLKPIASTLWWWNLISSNDDTRRREFRVFYYFWNSSRKYYMLLSVTTSPSLVISGTKLFQPIRMVVKHFFVPSFLNSYLWKLLLSRPQGLKVSRDVGNKNCSSQFGWPLCTFLYQVSWFSLWKLSSSRPQGLPVSRDVGNKIVPAD